MRSRVGIISINFLWFFLLLTIGVFAKNDICIGIGFIGTGILIGVWQVFHNIESKEVINWTFIIMTSLFDVIVGITYLL